MCTYTFSPMEVTFEGDIGFIVDPVIRYTSEVSKEVTHKALMQILDKYKGTLGHLDMKKALEQELDSILDQAIEKGYVLS